MPEQHGHKRVGKISPEYRTWLGIKRRCYDSKFKDYPNWGGRGITVCDRWRYSFTNFLCDMGRRPEGFSIDRLDHDGNYEPYNCRWIEQHRQAAENTRRLSPVTVMGVEYISQNAACRAFNVSNTTVCWRLQKGWTIDDAYSTPVRALANRQRRAPPQKIGHIPQSVPPCPAR